MVSTASLMPVYLALCQFTALAAFLPKNPRSGLLRDVLVAQSVLLVGFFVVWGGYSTDAWSYLSGFDGSPLVYDKEWLFYSIGYVLNKLVFDPWPLRIISSICVLVMVVAVLSYFGRERRRDAIIALFLLAMIPAFFMTFGNAVRQGLAASIIVLALTRSLGNGSWWLVAAAVVAWFIHQPSILLVGAAFLARIDRRWLAAGLLLAPVAGFVAIGAARWAGFDLDQLVPYAERSEGVFHWAKFAVAYAAAGLALFAAGDGAPGDRVLLRVFVSMVMICACVAPFEVPFERLLAYAEVLVPLVGPAILARLGVAGRSMRLLWLPGLVAGIFLWTHESVRVTLGFP